MLIHFAIAVGVVSLLTYLICLIADGPSTKYYIIDEEK